MNKIAHSDWDSMQAQARKKSSVDKERWALSTIISKELLTLIATVERKSVFFIDGTHFSLTTLQE